VAGDGSVLLSWLERLPSKQHRVRAARLRSGAWEPAITIVDDAELFANWADVPSVSAQGGLLLAHWLEKSGTGTYAYHVKMRVSSDNGRTWSAPAVAHSDRSETEHGFVSFFTRPDRKPGLTWLDGRETGGGHSGHGGGPMTLRAAAAGPGGTTDEVLLDGRVCDCCPTAAISTPDAAIVAYRDRSEKEVRDISVVRYARGAWSKPVTMNDGWQIGGCPVNGPSLAAHGRRVALAWFTAANNKPAVKVSHSKDSGATWSAPVVLSTGIPLGRVATAITSDGRTHVAWLDHNEGNGRLLLRSIGPTGAMTPPATLTAMKTDRNSGYPRLVADGASLIYAWTEVGADRTTKVRIGRK
ncbi:MAG: hypothetical protein WD690_02560, partial [Vicinamibacterales bacterium]